MRDFQSARKARPSNDDAHRDPDNVVQFADKVATAAKREVKKTFTSEKLTWINTMMMDHRIEALHRLIGIAIAQTISEDTEESITRDRVIADRLGVSVRSVVTARHQLRDLEWLAWHKPDPRKANRTQLVLTEKNIRCVEDQQLALKDQRDFEAPKPRTKRQKS